MYGLTIDFEHEGVVFRLRDGTPVLAHYSFGIIALFVTAPLWLEGRLSSLVLVAAMIAILFISILAHELGHKAAAERQGARARQIDIAFYGGLTRLEWDHHRGIAMRPVALAGPAVSLGLAGIFFALYWLAMRAGAGATPRFFEPFSLFALVARALWLAGLLNLWLGLFNLLPAYPLDGGVIAEDLLGKWLGGRRARLIVGTCGMVVASVGMLVAFVTVLAGIPVLMPASFRVNREAVLANSVVKRPIPSQSPPKRVTSVLQFRKRGGSQ
jgi:Zn-dependent protease